MDFHAAQQRLQALNLKLADMGYKNPDCHLDVHVDHFWTTIVADHPSGKYDDGLRKYFRAETIERAFEKAEAFAPPCPKEKLHRDFMDQLGKVIDRGRDIGIDVEFLNPLEQSMRSLSENILEHTHN